jgi:hypothetical protein
MGRPRQLLVPNVITVVTLVMLPFLLWAICHFMVRSNEADPIVATRELMIEGLNEQVTTATQGVSLEQRTQDIIQRQHNIIEQQKQIEATLRGMSDDNE